MAKNWVQRIRDRESGAPQRAQEQAARRSPTPPRMRPLTVEEMRSSLLPYGNALSVRDKQTYIKRINAADRDELIPLMQQKGIPLERPDTPTTRAQSSIPKPPALEEYYGRKRTPSERTASLKPGEKRSKAPSHIPMSGLESPMEESSVLQSLRKLFEEPRTTYEDPEPGQRLSTLKPAVSIAKEAARKKTATPARARSDLKSPMEELITPTQSFEQAPIDPRELRAKSPFDRPEPSEIPKGYDPYKAKAILDKHQAEIAARVRERPQVDTTAMLNSASKMRELPETTEVTHGPKYFQMGEKERYALNNKAVSDWMPFVPEQIPIAPPSELMTYARNEYKDKLNPFSKESIDYNNELQGILNQYSKDKTSQNAVRPYLERMLQDPRMMQDELAQDARDHIKSMQEEAAQNLRENIFPKIHRQFQRPGLMSHGYHSKLRQKEIEKYNRGLQHSIAQTKGSYRHAAMGHALSHAKLLGEAAHTQEKAAVGDRDNELRAVQAMEKARENEFTRGGKFLEGIEKMGLQDQAHAQKNLTFMTNQQQRIAEHPLSQAAKLAELNRDFHPSQITSVTGMHGREPEKSALGNTWNAGAQAVGNIAGNMMGGQKPPFKKGGRIRKAIGGQVNPMQDVIQNAVIDKIDPITELRRMIQHSQGVQALQGRQQLKIGGSVDPIKAGAEDAKMYAGHDAMKHLLSRKRDTSLINSIGHGLDVAPSNTGGVADVMRAFSKGYTGAQGRLSEADELEYKLQQQLEAKAMKEREAAQKDRDLARQDQLAASTIEHHRMMNQKLGHEIATPKKPKLESHDRKILESAGNTLKTADPFIAKLDRLDELTGKIHTGGVTSDMPILGSPRVQSIFSGKQADYDEFDKIVNGIVTDATAAFGARGGARIAAIIEKGKPNRSMSAEGLKAIVAQMRDAVKEEEALAGSIYDQYEEGVAPTTALRNYTSQRTAKRDTPSIPAADPKNQVKQIDEKIKQLSAQLQ